MREEKEERSSSGKRKDFIYLFMARLAEGTEASIKANLWQDEILGSVSSAELFCATR
jgi:hypothetical protein